MPECAICGGRFAEHKCVYCNRSACSSCINVEISRCVKCEHKKSIPTLQFVRRNLILFIFLGTIWIYTVYPFPFLYALGFNVDMTVMQPILIATVVLAIPFLFMLRAWQKKPPR
jgi:hypothetical protein